MISMFVRRRPPSSPPLRGETPALHHNGREHLENANRQVADSEWIVAEWSNLIDAMRAEGRDVTRACNLLKTFKDNLEFRRSNRDLIQLRVAEAAHGLRWLPAEPDRRAFP